MDTRPKLVTNIGVTRGPYSIKVQFYVLLQPQNNFLTSNVERMFSTILEKKIHGQPHSVDSALWSSFPLNRIIVLQSSWLMGKRLKTED